MQMNFFDLLFSIFIRLEFMNVNSFYKLQKSTLFI